MNRLRTRLDSRALLAGLALLALVAIAFWPVAGYSFLNLDDDVYVFRNSAVLQGLSPSRVLWAFTTTHDGNWYPLTLLSHMLDVTVFGLRPGLHHLVNLALHAASVLLLFSALRKMTGDLWRSAAVAAVFAVHPLQVESVAWIAERKNLLFGFFSLLALRAYASYAPKPTKAGYAAVTAAVCAALMSKPAAVPLPLALLLLDYWPLARKKPWSALLFEKMPWLALSAGASIVALRSTHPQPLALAVRLANGSLSCVSYLRKLVWPSGLAVFYPHPGASVSYVAATLAAAALAALLIIALRQRNRPWLAVGALWFLLFLLPALGVVQVGRQAMADRYAYLALIGPFLALAWSFPKKLERSKPALLGAGFCLVGLLLVCARQLVYWSDSRALFERAVEVNPDSAFARVNLSFELLSAGDVEGGVDQARAAVTLAPDDPTALNNLGRGLILQKRYAEAEQSLLRARKLDPGNGTIELNLAQAQALGRAASR